MRRFLLALMMTLVVASLQAITIKWSLPDYDGVDGVNVAELAASPSSFYFVYAQAVQDGDGTQPPWDSAAAVANAREGGYKITAADNTGAGSVTTLLGGATNFDVDPVMGGRNGKIQLSLNEAGLGTGGYFYLVVFTEPDASGEATYIVSQAVQYTGTEKTDAINGIYGTTVDGDAPNLGAYVDVTWMGESWTGVAAPEPTALALLALGVAGLALRRKI